MGAGTAVMLTMMLREQQEFSSASCVALACPACMTLELAASCKDYVTSIVNGTDLVPTFCAGARWVCCCCCLLLLLPAAAACCCGGGGGASGGGCCSCCLLLLLLLLFL